MSESAALAVIEGEVVAAEKPSALMRKATDVASVCKEIVMRTAMELKERKYVKVEGWMSIAAAYGCVPSIRSVEEDERGVKAVAELRRADGTVIATAEGYVGLDEPRWATQPLYARRGMAQTRAVSRVCRSVFAFVVVLIDEKLETTPAEEIPHGDAPAPSPRYAPTTPAPTSSAAPVNGAPERSNRTKVRYGKDKGKYLCDVADLSWNLAAAKKAVEANDPQWHAKNMEWLQLVEAELARRGQK